jgi:FkbM family methyltransferase
MQKVTESYYIDCGAHHGETVKEFLDTGVITSEYNIICFEPNVQSFGILSENTDLFSKFKSVELNQNAIWESKGSKIFRMESYAPEKYDGCGSTLIAENSWFTGYGVYDRNICVITVDLDSLIKELVDKHETPPNIVVKLDIEGSEFVVLEKMISSGTIQKVSKLFIEFHAWAMRDNIQQYQVRQENIIAELTRLGINWSMWK